MSRTLDGSGAAGVRGIPKTQSRARRAASARIKKAPTKIHDHNPPKAIAARSKGGIQRRKV